MSLIAGGPHIVMVWQDAPPASLPAGYTGACVKVCDGMSTQDSGGFSWAGNYATWRERFGDGKVGAWAVAYPQDGARFGDMIAAHAPHTQYVVLDIEDFGGVRWNDAAITAVVDSVKRAVPHAWVGYSSYPTRSQCTQHGINQALLEDLCHFSVPQVYYPYQRDAIAEIDRDNTRAVWAVSPADDPHWDASAKASLARSGQVMYWRQGVAGWERWAKTVTGELPQPAPQPPASDPMRPSVNQIGFPPRFVAWDGKGWWYTDLIFRRELSEDQARGLANGRVPVVLWPHVTSETSLVRPS